MLVGIDYLVGFRVIIVTNGQILNDMDQNPLEWHMCIHSSSYVGFWGPKLLMTFLFVFLLFETHLWCLTLTIITETVTTYAILGFGPTTQSLCAYGVQQLEPMYILTNSKLWLTDLLTVIFNFKTSQ